MYRTRPGQKKNQKQEPAQPGPGCFQTGTGPARPNRSKKPAWTAGPGLEWKQKPAQPSLGSPTWKAHNSSSKPSPDVIPQPFESARRDLASDTGIGPSYVIFIISWHFWNKVVSFSKIVYTSGAKVSQFKNCKHFWNNHVLFIIFLHRLKNNSKNIHKNWE